MGAGGSKGKLREVLTSLNEHDISPDDIDFWDQLWTFPSSVEDVVEIISPSSVRRLRQNRPQNIASLFTQAVAHLCATVEEPSTVNLDKALSCIRFLTRMMPFLLEGYRDIDTGEIDPFLDNLFWGTRSQEEQNSSGDESKTGDGAGLEGDRQSMGSLLVQAIMQLLFLKGFTLSPDATESISTGEEAGLTLRNPSLCWADGIGATRGMRNRSSRALERNRMEVMRLLLVLLCQPLYLSGEEYAGSYVGEGALTGIWRFGREATSAGTPYAVELFTSLVNVSLGFDPNGWGVPFGSAVSSDAPTRQMDMAVQLLIALLDVGCPPCPAPFAQPNDDDDDASFSDFNNTNNNMNDNIDNINNEYSNGGRASVGGEEETAAGEQGYNVYRELAACGIKGEADFFFIFEGLRRLLNNVHESKNTYIPGAHMTVGTFQELLVLFWKLLESNPAFLHYTLKNCDINQIVVPICYLLLEHRRDVGKSGLIHICTFILLKLSGYRNFSVGLKKPYAGQLPTDLPLFHGNHADLLFTVLHKLIVSGASRLSSLYHCFLTIMCNVSPYCKSLSMVAAVKLVNLFDIFTTPTMLYQAENHGDLVGMLLEIFNYIIQYQYAGNPELLFSIIRRRDLFENLYRLTLPRAIEAACLVPAVKQQQSQKPTVPVPTTQMDARNDLALGESAEEGLSAAPDDIITSGSTHNARRTSVGGSVDGDASVSERRTIGSFIPTKEWLDQLKSEPGLVTIMKLIRHLGPEVEEMCKRGASADIVVEHIRDTTMVGLLPVPHPIVIRKYQPNRFTSLWFTAFLWGAIFVRQEIPMFDGLKIRLFHVSLS